MIQALSPQNLSSGFLTKRVSNQSPKLQRLARNFTCGKFTDDNFQNANNKGVDQTAQAGLCLCFLPTPKDRFSRGD